MSKKNREPEPTCPCGSGSAYAACCGPLHAGTPATDAEALMRSRYSAYALKHSDYLQATWHASTRPPRLDLNAESPAPKWIGLQVLRHEAGETHSRVEFIARCRIDGRAQRLHEISRFVRENGRWYYLEAEDEANH